MIEESRAGGVAALFKKLITRMKAMLIAFECLDPSCDEEIKKSFKLLLLAATNWSNDALEATLSKNSETRSDAE